MNRIYLIYEYTFFFTKIIDQETQKQYSYYIFVVYDTFDETNEDCDVWSLYLRYWEQTCRNSQTLDMNSGYARRI